MNSWSLLRAIRLLASVRLTPQLLLQRTKSLNNFLLSRVAASRNNLSATDHQLLTDWLGEAGMLKKYSVSYKAMTFPGERLLLRGQVTKKSDAGDGLVTLSIWAENPRGEKTVAGTAAVRLPARPD